MFKYNKVIVVTTMCMLPLFGFAQSQDTTTQLVPDTTIFSGALGLTNNGFSIIPTFSLNSPAMLIQLFWRKNKFSIDPDFRLTPDAEKGGLLFWFRYHAIKKDKFNMRVGTHPAFSLIRKEVIEDGVPTEITEMLRFLAWELVPSYQINKHWRVGIYYLQGNGLQDNGPQTTHFVNLNTSISDIKLNKNVRFSLFPVVYYLYLDGNVGYYWTATGILSHTELPFTLQSAVNKTISSNLPDNKDFLWNVSVHYNFSKKLVKVE